MSDNWTNVQLWRKQGENCLVEIQHSLLADADRTRDRGPHRWYLYVYVYPKHPLFSQFVGDSLSQEATRNMPLHGGCSYLRWHFDNAGDIASIQVGCDYDHAGDESRTYEDVDDLRYYQHDAQTLLDWMSTQF